jgi:rRNA biogenesis protein RRP5
MTALSVLVSLPHQMIGHIPIDKISKGLNDAIDKLVGKDDNSSDSEASSNDKESDDEEEMEGGAMKEQIPTLQDIFHPGQYVRAIVTAVHPHGVVAPPSTSGTSLGKPRNELEKASRRVELSLLPQDVNNGITVKDLGKGFVSKTIPVRCFRTTLMLAPF